MAGTDHLVFGESGGTADLGGKTLEVSMDTGANGSVYLCNSVISNGTLDVVSGGLLCTVEGNSVDASTVDLKMNCWFSLAADLSVHDYEALYSGTANAGSAALNVYGTFKPSSHDCFRYTAGRPGST